ncbi:MAG: hypothetical protein JWO97_1569 [Acidobacteria bacterium]|nr:hypothetical protein [Acidobacteriota bacterium]
MSDYLRGVVTRVLAPHRALQPRPAMPFEFESHAAEEPSAAALPSLESAPASATPLRATRANRAPRLEVTSTTLMPEPHERFVHEPPAMSTQNDNDATELMSPVPLTRLSSPHEPLIEEVRSTQTKQHNVETIEQSIAQPAAEAARTTISVASNPLPRTLPVRRLVRDRRESEGRSSTPIAAAPIEITIGRIDVRAVVAPAQPVAKPREKAVVMSLDDYLATRGGGA